MHTEPHNFVFNTIIDKVEIRMTKSCGRGVFAKIDIKAGETILIEKALAVGNFNDGNVSSFSKVYHENENIYNEG